MRPARPRRKGGAAVLIRLGWLLAAAVVAPASAASPGLLVTVGEVTDTAAVVWLRGVTWGEVSVRYESIAGVPAGARRIRVTPSRHLTGKLVLQPLEPGTRYRYVIAQNQDEIVGEFATAPAPGSAAPIRFTWSGDLGSRENCRPPHDGYAIFRARARSRTPRRSRPDSAR